MGDAAILPGLVNAHTHLEFSDLRTPLGEPGMRFPDWIRLVVQNRRSHFSSPGLRRLLRRIEAGLSESRCSGVTALGEIASQHSGQDGQIKTEVTEFIEFIGLRPLDTLSFSFFESLLFGGPDTIHYGISPHAPYSVHPNLMQMCVDLSVQWKCPLAHHLAESHDEIELLRDGTGQFVPLLEDLGAWDPEAIPRGSRPLDYLQMASKAHRALIVHGNYLDDEEIEFLAKNSATMSVVYCPRTHDYFRHDPYPLAKMLSAGANVALGTDSRASNPDLSILAEMRFAAKRHPLVSPERLLRMITADSARALGRDQEIGTITPGKFADLAILAAPKYHEDDPHELLLDPATRVVATVFRGRAVFGEQC